MSVTPGISPGIVEPFWQGTVEQRLAAFAAIRDQPELTFHEESGGGPGFWSVTRYADLVAVSRDPQTYTSTKGFQLNELPQEALEFVGSMIVMDDPRHKRLRGLVQGAFTPRRVRDLEVNMGRRTDAIIEKIGQMGEFDWVSEVAAELPLQVVCDLLDIPEGDRPMLRRRVDEVIGASDPSVATPSAAIQGLLEMYTYAIELGEKRKANPGSDITSQLMTAEIDGVTLSPAEYGSFMILLIGAGNDTTKTSLSWAMHLLTEHPDQRQELAKNFDDLQGNAIEEIVRWCSPVLHMRRQVTADSVLSGTKLSAGDKVVMWYLAGNHDPAVFPNPHQFDIHRSNAARQIGYGAAGPHFCLGAHLARLEMRMILGKVLATYPHIRALEDPQLLLSPFVNGVKSLLCSVTS